MEGMSSRSSSDLKLLNFPTFSTLVIEKVILEMVLHLKLEAASFVGKPPELYMHIRLYTNDKYTFYIAKPLGFLRLLVIK